MLEKRFKNFKISQVPPLIPPPTVQICSANFHARGDLGGKNDWKMGGAKKLVLKTNIHPCFSFKEER